MINFSDLTFIFRFLPVFLIAFFLTPTRYRKVTLFVGSLLFYAVGDLKMFPVLLGAIIINFLFAKALRGSNNKLLFGFIIVLDALMLIEFKLLGQFVDNSFLPVGISFFTFKMISFQVDNYRADISKEPKFIDVAAYFCMFPQVVSGPIMRYSDFEKNVFFKKNDSELEVIDLDDENADEMLEEKEVDNFADKKNNFAGILEAIEDGLRYFVVGLGMKVLLADHLAMLWKDIGTIGYESVSTPLAWLGAVAYSLELYFDFWGYSLMAAGVGMMIGFPFIVNFDQPYKSKNVGEFYRRWHATLGSWFRDYIYIPMGGSRKGDKRTVLNLLVVWLITGFWHGVTLNFILWGVSIFIIIFCEKYLLKKLPEMTSAVIGRINVLVLIPLTWVIFAISDSTMLADYFMRLFPFFGAGIAVNEGDFAKNLGMYWLVLLSGLLLLVPQIFELFEKYKKKPVFTVLLLILFWACIYSLSNAAGNPFMYFRF